MLLHRTPRRWRAAGPSPSAGRGHHKDASDCRLGLCSCLQTCSAVQHVQLMGSVFSVGKQAGKLDRTTQHQLPPATQPLQAALPFCRSEARPRDSG